jgi:hypothetical protein
MSDLDPQAARMVAEAPMPTPKTLANRENVLYQLMRFAALNLKMIKVIGSSRG